jgi:hypothetical protein
MFGNQRSEVKSQFLPITYYLLPITFFHSIYLTIKSNWYQLPLIQLIPQILSFCCFDIINIIAERH